LDNFHTPSSLVTVLPVRLGGWRLEFESYIRCCVCVSWRATNHRDPLSREVKSKSECITLHPVKMCIPPLQISPAIIPAPHPYNKPVNGGSTCPTFPHMRGAMELYLIPNDPVNTTLITSDGYLRYLVRTSRPLSSLKACSSIIQRPSVHDNNEHETLGEITWGGLGRHSVIHSDLFKGRVDVAGGKAVRVKDLLWKINTFGK
jgi:hypothetical protein